MATIRVKIASTVGLHARPAGLFAQAAARQPMPVFIGRPGEKGVAASSILAVMALGVKYEEEVELTADGDGADTALAELAALLARNLDATPAS